MRELGKDKQAALVDIARRGPRANVSHHAMARLIEWGFVEGGKEDRRPTAAGWAWLEARGLAKQPEGDR